MPRESWCRLQILQKKCHENRIVPSTDIAHPLQIYVPNIITKKTLDGGKVFSTSKLNVKVKSKCKKIVLKEWDYVKRQMLTWMGEKRKRGVGLHPPAECGQRGRQIGTRGEKIIFSNIGFLDHAGESCFNRWIIMYFASRKFFWDLQISRQQFARLSPPSQGSSLQIDAFQAPLISASHIHNPAFQPASNSKKEVF